MITSPFLKAANEDSFEQIDSMAARSANSIYNQWSLAIDNSVNKQKIIFERLKQLNMYFDTILQDEYLVNLYLISLGCRSQKDSLYQTMQKMERVRLLILKNISGKNKKGFATPEISQHIYDDRPEIKAKFILRFATIKKATRLLFEKLMAERNKIGLPVMELESHFSENPDRFIKKLNEFLEGIH